jgi:hypothetical protein
VCVHAMKGEQKYSYTQDSTSALPGDEWTSQSNSVTSGLAPQYTLNTDWVGSRTDFDVSEDDKISLGYVMLCYVMLC